MSSRRRCPLFEELFRLADGKIAFLTVAPELPGALALVRYAVGLGVRVSIGHTLADEGAVRAAVDAGARFSTHLGNGCPNLLHRHHNPIWPQLASRELSAMLISDGHHLPPAVIAAFLAAKGAERVVITSDVSPVAGCAPGEYMSLARACCSSRAGGCAASSAIIWPAAHLPCWSA